MIFARTHVREFDGNVKNVNAGMGMAAMCTFFFGKCFTARICFENLIEAFASRFVALIRKRNISCRREKRSIKRATHAG